MLRLNKLGGGILLELLAPQLMDPKLPEDPDQLNWLRAMVFAVMSSCSWDDEMAEEKSRLVRLFAEVERAYLPLCYRTTDESGLRFMPPVHRAGWYLARAFEALDCGDKAGYIRLLKQALLTHESTEPMIQFLFREFDKLQRRGAAAGASQELRMLAEQIKTLLAQYPEDHPAVQELKQSELYQEVAFLIEDSSKGVLS